MEKDFVPGNALACLVNAHRHNWDGRICTDPVAWNCCANPGYTVENERFRNDYCAADDNRCHHLRLFQAASPMLSVDDKGLSWLVERDHRAIDNQVLLLFSREAREPVGVDYIEGRSNSEYFCGAYRIQRVEASQFGRRYWRIFPHPEEWTRFPRTRVQVSSSSLDGPYMRQVHRSRVKQVFLKVAAELEERTEDGWTPEDQQRFEHFQSNLDGWLDGAAELWPVAQPSRLPGGSAPVADSLKTRPFAGLQLSRSAELPLKADAPEPPDESVAEAPAPAAREESPAEAADFPGLVEPGCVEEIRDSYDSSVIERLELGACGKTILVLAGPPGVGKSHLAVHLLDDPERKRTFVVPVGATWRGREDFLGYVSPIDGRFQPTAVAEFLRDAEVAFREGDHRTRIVVLEEFNLSQPEHWLSDILVASEFQDPADRVIELGGNQSPEQFPKRLTLSPKVKFVATVNSDHTTRQLSHRVLDRAALVQLTLSPRGALKRTGLELPDEQLEAIEDLHNCVHVLGAGFSLRTARSLLEGRRISEHLATLGPRILDLTLTAEVLSKVALLAHDERDRRVMERLQEWRSEHGALLPECDVMIEGWAEVLSSGRDVIQV